MVLKTLYSTNTNFAQQCDALARDYFSNNLNRVNPKEIMNIENICVFIHTTPENAFVLLYHVEVDGKKYREITAYRHRSSPSGFEQVLNFFLPERGKNA